MVVSPLIALMTDQLAGLERAGIPAAALHSGLADDEQRAALARARAGELSLLYVAPERFHSSVFRRAMAEARVALLVIDEAHCVSEWGHEFRPDYRRVGQFRQELRPRATMALTATATARVRADVARRLGLDQPARDHRRLRPPQPHLRRPLGGGPRARWRASGRRCWPPWPAPTGARRSSTAAPAGPPRRPPPRSTAAGHTAVVYHAGRSDRAAAQEAFSSGRAQVVAATNAFGMGVNVPDVRLVVHTALPDSLEQLYQEAGPRGPRRRALAPRDRGRPRRRDRHPAAHLQRAHRRLRGRAAARPAGRRARTRTATFHLDRREVDDETGFRLAMAERVGALEVEGAPGGGRARAPGHRPAVRPTSARTSRARSPPSCAAATAASTRPSAYMRGERLPPPGVPAATSTTPPSPRPEERCCDVCSPPRRPRRARAPSPRTRRAPAPPRRRPRRSSVDERARLRRPAGLARRGGQGAGLAGVPGRVQPHARRRSPRPRRRDERTLAAVRGVGPWLMETHAPRILDIVASAGG